MTRDTAALCSKLQAAVPEIVHGVGQLSSLECKVIAVERTADEQHRLYQEGRTDGGRVVTMLDGYTRKSAHQKQLAHGEDAVHAVDFGFFEPDGAYVTEVGPYESLTIVATSLGLVSGGNWTTLRDRPHVQCQQPLI